MPKQKPVPQHMHIRRANHQDSNIIASYILLAMQDIVFEFIGEVSTEKALQFLQSLTQETDNQYSYENCWVMEQGQDLLAVALVYDGAQLEPLRAPVAHRIHSMFNRPFHPEDETQAGEQYIDCLAVHPNHQGKGIGTKMLQFLKDEYVHKNRQTLGLLVDTYNPYAKKLYIKEGFRSVGYKTLTAKILEHLQYKSVRF